jgi:hypothetical protein
MKFIFSLILFLSALVVDAQLLGNFQKIKSLSSVDGISAIWSVHHTNKSYLGPAVKIVDDNTSADLGDFNFVNGVWDYASIDAALAGHVGRVHTIYDQSGNGYHAVQTTKVNMAYYKTASYAPNGVPCAFFNRKSGDQDHFYNITMPTDSHDFAWCGVAEGYIAFFPGTASTDVLFSFGGAPAIATLSDNTVFRSGTKSMLFNSGDVSPLKSMNVTQIGIKNKQGVGCSYFYENVISESYTAFTTQRVNTTAILGKRSNGTNKQLGIFQELIVYNSTLSSDNESRMKADQRHCFKITNKTEVIIFSGHSKAHGYQSAVAFNEPVENQPAYKLARLHGERYLVYSYGIPSATIQSLMASNAWTTIKRIANDYPGLRTTFIYHDPGNNLGTDDYATLTGRIDLLISQLRTAAPNVRIILNTITDRVVYVTNPTWGALRLQINTYLLSLHNPANNIYTVDLTLNPNIGPNGAYTNSYHDVDQVHFSPTGNQELANENYNATK